MASPSENKQTKKTWQQTDLAVHSRRACILINFPRVNKALKTQLLIVTVSSVALVVIDVAILLSNAPQQQTLKWDNTAKTGLKHLYKRFVVHRSWYLCCLQGEHSRQKSRWKKHQTTGNKINYGNYGRRIKYCVFLTLNATRVTKAPKRWDM